MMTRRRAVVLVILQALPAVLWVVLNFLRPDLMQAMLDSDFGYRVTQLERVLWLVEGGLLFAAARWIESPGKYGTVSTVIFVLVGLPLLGVILFAPVVHAFQQTPP